MKISCMCTFKYLWALRVQRLGPCREHLHYIFQFSGANESIASIKIQFFPMTLSKELSLHKIFCENLCSYLYISSAFLTREKWKQIFSKKRNRKLSIYLNGWFNLNNENQDMLRICQHLNLCVINECVFYNSGEGNRFFAIHNKQFTVRTVRTTLCTR